MPYIVRKSKGVKPYEIVSLSTKTVVGRSTSKSKAQRSIGYRHEAEYKKALDS